jgi:predicted metal-dependent phosphotriesterase family hydrolase
LDNVHLNSEKVAEAELLAFRAAGGKMLVDTTVATLGRNPRALRRLAKTSNLHVVMGCGFGVAPSHPTWLAAETPESMAAMMERELVGGTIESDEEGRLRAGFIGGIGISAVPHEVELRVVRAAVKAALKTGAPIFIEPAYMPSGQAREYLDGILDVICKEIDGELHRIRLVLLRCGYLCEVPPLSTRPGCINP